MALVADTNVYSLDSDCFDYETCELPRLITRSLMFGSTVFDNALASLFGCVATLYGSGSWLSCVCGAAIYEVSTTLSSASVF